MTDSTSLQINGVTVTVPAGSMVSTAVAASGVNTFRRSVTGEARAPLCGMGICFECRVTIDGRVHSRSCQIISQDRMTAETDCKLQIADCISINHQANLKSQLSNPKSESHTCEVLVVGAGPAGIAAAYRAAQSGQQVCVVDDNPAPAAPGGQIWRGDQAKPSSPDAKAWFERLKTVNAGFIHGARIFAQPSAGRLLAETWEGVCELRYEKLILATGARERFLPFPGWTLPGVTGAGGLQALAKSGFPIAGKRIVVAGSGPLLMAVAAYLKKSGAEVLLIAEQAPWSRLLRFGVELLRQPSKIAQAIELKKQLAGVPYLPGCWPVAAKGEDKLAAVAMQRGRKTWDVECDYLACGFYLTPNIELAAMLGCAIENGAVAVNEFQQTSLPGVYCAGETTGIGGLELSLVEGQIAGCAAAGDQNEARKLFAERARQRRFAQVLNQTFALREELRSLPAAGTLVCRCEDVTYGRLQNQDSWRTAKLQTRCGMGPCQGRICGAATEFLFGWGMESVRPPVFPVRLANLAKALKSSNDTREA